MMFKEQAEKCRRQAGEFAGRPEAPFLLKVASAFDELATERAPAPLAGRPVEPRDSGRALHA